MQTQAEIRRSSCTATRAKARSAAESHPRYEPGGSHANAEYGARNPCSNYAHRTGPCGRKRKDEEQLGCADQGLDR